MLRTAGKYEKKTPVPAGCPYVLVGLAFLLVEVFACWYLKPEKPLQTMTFGLFWAAILSGGLGLLPRRVGRIAFALVYGGAIVYAVGQTGYYQLFSEMMWASEFRYASEGSDYLDVLLSYPPGWFLWIVHLIVFGVVLVWKFPGFRRPWLSRGIAGAAMACGMLLCGWLLQEQFAMDREIRYARSDYGRMQSSEAAYENLFNAHRLYEVCGLYHTFARDVYANVLYPLAPGYGRDQEASREKIDAWFAQREPSGAGNAMTGLLAGKNVVLVLMESMDDWMLGDHTPTINRLMEEGICFSNFYTPPYGGIRTFNTEFCINTGSFLSSQGGYAFDYVGNTYSQSLAALLTAQGYSAKTFHYNDPTFYSRDVFSEALGYEEYVYYRDYLTEYTEKEQKELLYDDLVLFRDPELYREFFRPEEKTLNFVITRSAHLSYQYNEVLSHWGLKKYPQYRGMTGSEETDCALLKARLVDDFFQWLLMSLEDEGKLEDTVIIAVTDHYAYGYKDQEALMDLSGVEEKLLLEKTPCFIWSPGLSPMTVDKPLNTSDLLPTVLNLLGVESEYRYMGRDAFDESYEGWVLFADGSWITSRAAYAAGSKKLIPFREGDVLPEGYLETMSNRVEEFVRINNLILDTDYYAP